jgi:hypothetical protein
MKSLNRLFLVAAAMSMGTATVFANEPDGESFFQQEIEENDEDELLNFINAKRSIPLADKSKNLSIAGEVHLEWNFQKQKINGQDVRKYVFRELEEWDEADFFLPTDTIKIGPNDFDAQFDFFMDWKTDRTWARTHLRYDNSCGVVDNGLDPEIDPQGYHGSGSVDNLALKEAYVGYEIFKNDDHRLTLELGRRGNIYKVLYSEIQFSSRLDGIILKYAGKLGRYIEDWYLTTVGFVVDERSTQYAWAVEIGLNNLLDSGVDFKYSFIDWKKRSQNRFFVKNPIGFRFRVSQWTLLYNVTPDWLCNQPLELSMAFMMNHTPARFTFINVNPNPSQYTPLMKKIGTQNLGGFVNIQYREINKEGDWFASALIGFCQAQCIPDNDVRNIGTGNLLHESMTSDGRGNTNWQAYSLKLGYAVTDNWVFETQYNHSWSIKSIAGTQGYTRYTLESIYSF